MKKSLMTLATGMILVAMTASCPAAETTPPPITLNSVVVTTSKQTAPLAQGVTIAGIPVLDQPALLAKLNRHIGQAITRESLQELLAEINGQLAAAGETFSVASLPAQDISSGRLTVLVIRAHVGEVRVRNAGAGTFSDADYRRLLRLKPGDVLEADTLEADVDWINRSNTYRNAQVMTQPGKEIGQTDVELLVADRRPYGFSASYDNNGTERTGQNRITLSGGWGNAFGTDQQLSYTLNANPNFDNYVAHSVSYVVPLPWRHLLSVSANYADIKSKMPEPFDSHGNNLGFSVRYDIPLKNVGRYSHGANLGFDFKRSDNNLLFSQTPVTNTLTKIYQLNAGYSATLPDAHGATSAGINWVHSPGGVGHDNSDAAFDAARLGAVSKYDYQTLSLQRQTRLPAKWLWLIDLHLQHSDANLLGSEQLSAGGVRSVRGFAEAIAFGDEGTLLRTELQSPAKPLGAGARLQGVLFYDAARLNNVHLLSGEAAAIRLSSVGLGFRLNLPRQISVNVDAAKRLTVDVPGATAAHLIHVSVAASF